MESQETRGAQLCSRVLIEVDATINRLLRGIAENGEDSATLLDIGCWDGRFTRARAEAVGAKRMLGIEVFDQPAEQASELGIEVARVDLETGQFPWPDSSVDVVVCNQVLEHLKNVWLPMSEMHRVLRPGGHAVLSVPNLASLHNRVLLMLGRQPTSIRVFGPHVRGYTLPEFSEFVERDGAYEIERRKGVGFYPFPPLLSRPLSALWRGASHTFIVVARKASERPAWSEYLSTEISDSQTFYAPEPPG
jgi:SAM-dependent methyltransferase